MNALMSPYLDGLLNVAQTRRLECHIVSCSECRYKIELMKEIPQALQTDRVLVPRPEFTAMIMQQVVIKTQLQNSNGTQTSVKTKFQTETRYTSRNAEEHLIPSAKLLTLPRSTKSPGAYVLRFSSLAAALVLAVGVGIYTLQIGLGSASGASASTSEGIALFARSLIDAFQSPAEVLVGTIIAAALLIVLWFFFRKSGEDGQFNPNELGSQRNLE